MRDCVDDGLRHHFLWNLVPYGCLNGLRPRAHRQRDLAKHKVHCLINQIEHRAFVNLVGWDRLGDLGSMEVGALDFRGEQKPLR